MSSSLRSGKGNREVSPPRRTSTVDLVKDLARLRDADPAKFPSAYAKLKVRPVEASLLIVAWVVHVVGEVGLAAGCGFCRARDKKISSPPCHDDVRPARPHLRERSSLVRYRNRHGCNPIGCA